MTPLSKPPVRAVWRGSGDGDGSDLTGDRKFRPQIEVLSAEDVPRRRNWDDADKIRIVEESFDGHRQVSDERDGKLFRW